MFRTMKIHDVDYIYDWEKTKVEQEFLRLSNFRSRHDLNMRGKIQTDF